jgi:hypothetical protein
LINLLSLFKGKNRSTPPKWRLVPDERGTYTLEKWHSDISMYMCETVGVTPEKADEQIANMEGKTLYYREET